MPFPGCSSRAALYLSLSALLSVGIGTVYALMYPYVSASLPSIDKDTHGFDGQKNSHAASKPLPIHKVLPAGFSLPERFSAPAKLLAPDSDGFLYDFWFLRRRRADARQGEKDKKHLAHSMQSPAKRVCMEKEEGDCIVQLLPQGRSGTVQASSDVVRRVCSCQLMVSNTNYILFPWLLHGVCLFPVLTKPDERRLPD